jgi:hypothetical protein
VRDAGKQDNKLGQKELVYGWLFLNAFDSSIYALDIKVFDCNY